MKRIARAAKAILSALGSGASAAIAVASSGSNGTDTRTWIAGIVSAFVVGAIVYRVPNRPAV